MVLVFIVLIFFLVSMRAAVIVALTIPLSLLFAFHFPAWARRPGQPALHRRHRLRDHHRRHRGDDGKHLSRTGRAARTELQTPRGDHRRGARRGPAHLLFHRRHSCRIHPHLRPERARGQALPPHGRDHVLRSAGLAVLRPDLCSRAGLLLVQKGSERKTKPDVRVVQARVRSGAEMVPGPPHPDYGAGHDHLRRFPAAGALHRRRVHAAPG